MNRAHRPNAEMIRMSEERDRQQEDRPERARRLFGFGGAGGPNWRRIVGVLALLAAVVLVLKQWHRTRKVDLTVVVILELQVRSVTIQIFDPKAEKETGPIRNVRLEGTPGSHGETFSVPAGPYLLVLRTERLDGSVERTERKVSLSGDAKLTVHVR